MPQNVKCGECAQLRNGWCSTILDCPDPEVRRNCDYYSEARNIDRLRTMTPERLAEFFQSIIIDRNIGVTKEAWIEFLLAKAWFSDSNSSSD